MLSLIKSRKPPRSAEAPSCHFKQRRFHPLPLPVSHPPLVQPRADTREIASFCFTIWVSISPFRLPHSCPLPFSLSLSLSLFFAHRASSPSSLGRWTGRSARPFWIGRFSEHLHWRAFNARGGSSDEGGRFKGPGFVGEKPDESRFHRVGEQPRAPFESSRSTKKRGTRSLSRLFRLGRWKRPRTPVRAAAAYASRSFRPKKLRRDATRPTAIFLLIFPPDVSSLPPSLSLSLLPFFRYTYGVYAPARLLIREADKGDRSPTTRVIPPGKRTCGADKVREVPGEILRKLVPEENRGTTLSKSSCRRIKVSCMALGAHELKQEWFYVNVR